MCQSNDYACGGCMHSGVCDEQDSLEEAEINPYTGKPSGSHGLDRTDPNYSRKDWRDREWDD